MRTPMMWFAERVNSGPGYYAVHNGYKRIAENMSADDARFIVRACNHHDELVEALRTLAKATEVGDTTIASLRAFTLLAKLEADNA